eukprot:gene6952-7692_t
MSSPQSIPNLKRIDTSKGLRGGEDSPKRSLSPSNLRRETIGGGLLSPSLGLTPGHGYASRSHSPFAHGHHPPPESYLDRVRKNAKGGVFVSPEEVQAAFSMLDLEKNNVITLATLKKRLGQLFPALSAKDYRFLMNNKKELTLDDLKDLLLENEVTMFDPISEAFRAFDPDGMGYINEDMLRQAFIAFGLGELSDEELDILKRTADLDGDSRITVDDFRNLLEGSAKKGGEGAVPTAFNASLRR